MQEINHYINGRHTASSQRTSSVYEPATGEHRATVSLASAAEVDGAIELAKKAHKTWSQVSPLNRARVLFKFKALVEANMDEMAELITREHGKVIDDAKGEIIRGLEVVEFACGIPHLLKGEHTEQVGGGVDAWTVNQSLGVVAGIAPFNFPIMVPMWMFPIAIAAGNTFIMKPSEKDP
ncbi:MAG: aldehyde dehydrogenase family protein, partial [Shewanella sp.]|nr:aldehyde dehydrogenase family protein [Shewanella sp.]